MRIVFWGTYDTGKPRNRILLQGLRQNNVEVIECHAEVWRSVEDKSTLKGWRQKGYFLARWLLSYPGLAWRYLALPAHDAVVVGYLGQLDVLVLWLLARLRGVPVVWDAFLSLYDTVVRDRQMVPPHHPLALLLHGWEWLACRAADYVLLDTRAHADYFVEEFGVAPDKTGAVLVGAEPEHFSGNRRPAEPVAQREKITVLFYGQFIPLHGIEVIIRAARLLKDEPVEWILIGQGQEDKKIRGMLDAEPLPRLRWIPWVEYERLVEWIGKADLCLGIFGESAKAGRVIPNKVFQILSVGKPLVTRDSPAIRELLAVDEPGVFLITPGDPRELARAVRDFAQQGVGAEAGPLYPDIRRRVEPAVIGRELVTVLEKITGNNVSC